MSGALIGIVIHPKGAPTPVALLTARTGWFVAAAGSPSPNTPGVLPALVLARSVDTTTRGSGLSCKDKKIRNLLLPFFINGKYERMDKKRY